MNDKLYMENYLLILKSSMEVYVHGTLESSNPDVRSTLKEGLDSTIEHQANTYDKMTEYGWYTINNVSPSAINQKLTTIQSSN